MVNMTLCRNYALSSLVWILSCACAIMKNPNLFPLQILKSIRYFIHELLFIQYILGRMCFGLY